jgi:hypothetical protein
MAEGGFDDFPFLVPRWSKIAGEVYGRSPAMMVLPDIKMLQAMSKTTIKGAQKIVDPPLFLPDDGFLGPFRTAPGSLNYYRAATQAKVEPLVTGARIDLGLEMMNQRRDSIVRAFYVDMFQNLMMRDAKTPLSATEVMQRREEGLRVLAPIVARLQNEFLGPLIDRVFSIMVKMDEFPPAPASIAGLPLKVEFVSPAAIAQRASEVDNITRWAQLALPFLQLDPQAIDNINVDQIVQATRDLYNVNPTFTRSVEQVEELREKRAEEQQLMRLAAMAKEGGEAAQAVGDGAKALSGKG